MDRNKYFAELAGVDWHEFNAESRGIYQCVCTEEFQTESELRRHCKRRNNDYAGDPRKVLALMIRRQDWDRFCQFSLKGEKVLNEMLIPLKLVVDRTGETRELAIKWLGGIS